MIPRWPVHDPAESGKKVLKACQSLWRDTFSKNLACKNYTIQEQKDPCSKSLLAQFFLKIPWGIKIRGTTFEFEYFREFKSEFKNNLGYESGIHLGSIHEKNQRPKSHATVPLRQVLVCIETVNSKNIFGWFLKTSWAEEKGQERSWTGRRLQSCGIAKVKFWRSAIAVPQHFSSAIPQSFWLSSILRNCENCY
jgi:hypothetical protein